MQHHFHCAFGIHSSRSFKKKPNQTKPSPEALTSSVEKRGGAEDIPAEGREAPCPVGASTAQAQREHLEHSLLNFSFEGSAGPRYPPSNQAGQCPAPPLTRPRCDPIIINTAHGTIHQTRVPAHSNAEFLAQLCVALLRGESRTEGSTGLISVTGFFLIQLRNNFLH